MTTEQQAVDFIEDVQHFALNWKGVDCVDTDTERTYRKGGSCVILTVVVHYDEA